MRALRISVFPLAFPLGPLHAFPAPSFPGICCFLPVWRFLCALCSRFSWLPPLPIFISQPGLADLDRLCPMPHSPELSSCFSSSFTMRPPVLASFRDCRGHARPPRLASLCMDAQRFCRATCHRVPAPLQVWYCSDTCAKIDWQHHKQMCKYKAGGEKKGSWVPAPAPEDCWVTNAAMAKGEGLPLTRAQALHGIGRALQSPLRVWPSLG